MTETRLKTPTQEGWSVHVYDQERRLRCTIEPSHGQALGLGMVLGVLMTLVMTNINFPVEFKTSPAQPTEPNSGAAVKENHLPAPTPID